MSINTMDTKLDALSRRLDKKKVAAHKVSTKKRTRQKPVRSMPAETLIRVFCRDHDLDAEKILSGFRMGIAVLSDHLAQHQSVHVDGLGKFRWRPWQSRLGFNRYTGQQVVIPASMRLKFIPEESMRPEPLSSEEESEPAASKEDCSNDTSV